MALTSPALVAVLVALLIGLVVVSVRLRSWARLLSGTAAVTVLLLAGAAVANDHFVYLTSWRDLTGLHSRDLTALPLSQVTADTGPTVARAAAVARTVARPHAPSPHGVLVRVDIPGPRSGIDRGALVYLPAQYFSPAWAPVRFPVLELLHGSPGVPGDWIDGMRADVQADAAVRAHAAGPMVIVLPDSNGSRFRDEECANAAHGAQDETYLTSDVRSYLLAHLRVRTDRQGWLLAGYSTGGFCAVNLLAHHPDLYAGAASLDGYFTAVVDRYTGSLYGGNRVLRRYNSPASFWRTRPPAARTSLLLLAGANDDALGGTWSFARLVRTTSATTADVHVGVQPGAGHVFSSWRTMLPTVFRWAWSVAATPETATLAGTSRVPLPDSVALPPPGCQTPDGGLQGVPVCRGHAGHHWYRTPPHHRHR